MRVANRRLRAALALFADVLPGDRAENARGPRLGRPDARRRPRPRRPDRAARHLARRDARDRTATRSRSLRSLLHEQRESRADGNARDARLAPLRGLRQPLRPHAAGPPPRPLGPGLAAGRALAPDLIESRFRVGSQSRRPDRPRLAGRRLPPAQDPLQAPPLRARVPGRPLPGRDATADQAARRRPGRPRAAPGRGRRDRAPPPPRRLRRRRPRPRDDLRHGRDRRALPGVGDRVARAVPGRVRSCPASPGRCSASSSSARAPRHPLPGRRTALR